MKKSVDFYSLAWRWHFYAGLFVAPFMILLSLTGIIYLFKPQLDPLMYRDLLQVQPAAQVLDADRQLARLRQVLPQASVSQYLPPAGEGRSAQFVASLDGRETNLFLDPYSGELLGRQDAKDNLQAIARALHGELLLGTVGDRLVELAAGWGIVLVVSGVYLWWPRGRAKRGVLLPNREQRGRGWWRELHAVVGFWGALALLFMLLTGMTWTGYWGQSFADVWNRFPAAMWNEVPKSDVQARELNQAHRQTVPWAVENTPMPISGAHAGHAGHAADGAAAAPQVSLQRVLDIARERGVAPGYSVTLPTTAEGVFTVAVFADDPRRDATLHIDQYSGRVLADIGWKDYGLVARSVETGVMLHEGKMFGLANQLLMLAVCLMILFSAASGLWLWWLRKPAGRLGAPPLPHALPVWKVGLGIVLALGVAFPLVGLSLLLVWGLDWLVLSRLGERRAALS
ncbi:PepSY-associated TM helix domain-containing protein [Pseudomonas citronellolis]|uniref:PepSY-associated TM helix domain-containing protein n=1 Tax=Pseudomonas citronellolis TaxID=53408 RepID=UPI0023E36A4E|nr:PepSY domain-containing protein [Pseudomonas citronellolis]MDF3932594.1 PepSY domain-containing protein [Pseudomonas citronellolis]